MSDHSGTAMSTSLEQILEQLSDCPVRAAMHDPVPWVTGSATYQGRHRATGSAPIASRAIRRIVSDWHRLEAGAASLGARLGHRLADSINDNQADKLYDFLTGETFRDMSAGIARGWRNLDRAAYARLPKTWRHRLEARHRARQILDDSIQTTELWWAGRQADYAPALGLHTPTQPLKTLEETRTP